MTTNETVTRKIVVGTGYRGKGAGKSYIAKITGTDLSYIFARTFVETEPTDREAMFEARRKGKGTWMEAAALPAGLYETQEAGDRTYLVVWVKDGSAVFTKLTVERATKMAILLDQGKTVEEARVATKPEVRS